MIIFGGQNNNNYVDNQIYILEMDKSSFHIRQLKKIKQQCERLNKVVINDDKIKDIKSRFISKLKKSVNDNQIDNSTHYLNEMNTRNSFFQSKEMKVEKVAKTPKKQKHPELTFLPRLSSIKKPSIMN